MWLYNTDITLRDGLQRHWRRPPASAALDLSHPPHAIAYFWPNTDDDDDDDDNDEKKSNSKRQKRKGISPLKPVKIEDEGMGISI